MKKYNEVKKLPFTELRGISKTNIDNHYGKLYQGYVKKWQEIQEKLAVVDMTTANATFSELRALKVEESFTSNAIVLHEAYFDVLGGSGEVSGDIVGALAQEFGSYEKWLAEFKALSMCSRGWAVLAYDFNDGKLKNCLLDAHNMYGLMGTAPVVAIDMYEHAYFTDFGTDKKAYIETYLQNMNWEVVDKKFKAMK